MSRAKFTTQQFIDAIPKSGGIIATIAQRVGCEWNTAKKWIDNVPTVGKAYQDECERINDLAVSTILKSIQEGNTQDAKWWIARKRRHEFGDNIDITSKGEKIDFGKLSDDQLLRLINGDDPSNVLPD